MRSLAPSIARLSFVAALATLPALAACDDAAGTGAVADADALAADDTALAADDTALAADDTATADDTTVVDPCAATDRATAKTRFYFAMHVEEDDANCVAQSNRNIPDFNGDRAVFDHFADAWYAYAAMLADEGAVFSFQTDWTFVEGVENFRPSYFTDLLALGNVEIVPHAHETCVPYEALYERLAALGAEPVKMVGGMTSSAFFAKGTWFADHPGWSFWNGPYGTPNHVDDAPTPPFAYRIAPPTEATTIADLYVHRAGSPLVVTPGLGWRPDALRTGRPAGRYVVAGWLLLPDRWFLAEPDDTTVPAVWRKKPGAPTGAEPGSGANMSAAELTAWVRDLVRESYAPMVAEGTLEYAQPAAIVATFLAHEACLDLDDGEDLTPFIPAGGP